jgi:RNA polymerase sigma factor (sigma-70 family)
VEIPSGKLVSAVQLESELRAAFPALRVFFRHHLPLDRRDEAEDFAQETLLAAWRALALDAKVATHPTRYLLGIARHKCLDAKRRDGNQALLKPLPGEKIIAEELAMASAENVLMHAQIRRRMVAALAKLPPDERMLLHLCFLEGIPHGEACRHLGITPPEGSRLKYRAIERMRFLLRGVGAGIS